LSEPGGRGAAVGAFCRAAAPCRWARPVRCLRRRRPSVRVSELMWRKGCRCCGVVLPVGGCLPASGWLICLPMALGPGCPSVALPCWVYGYLMIWLSLPGCLPLVLSGRASAADHLFQFSLRPGSPGGMSPRHPASKEVDQAQPSRHLQAVRRRQKTPQAVMPMKPRHWDGGSNWWRKKPPPLDDIGMRRRSDTTAASAGQGERAGNRWIKWGSRIDLKDMRPNPIHQLAGALGASRRTLTTDRCAAHF
jgi:hypothetical protein